MKKSEVVKTIEYISHISEGDFALRVLSYLEDIGMLPPPCTVTIKDGKHTPTIRKWDDETE